MNKMFIRDAARLPVVQFQKDGYLRNQHNVLYQISVVPKISKRVAWKGRTLVCTHASCAHCGRAVLLVCSGFMLLRCSVCFSIILSFLCRGRARLFRFTFSLPVTAIYSDRLYYFRRLGKASFLSTTSLCLTLVYDALGYRASSEFSYLWAAFLSSCMLRAVCAALISGLLNLYNCT